MPGRTLTLTLLMLMWPTFLTLGLTWPVGAEAADAPDRFSRDIAPILVKRCLECHHGREASGKLVLSDKASLAKGGESGPVVVPRNPEQSQLLTRVSAGEMPPPKRGHSQKLPAAEIAALRDWIAAGADWPDDRKLDLFEATTEVRGGRDWWSLQPVKRPTVPTLVPSPPSSGERARVRGPNGDNAPQLAPAPAALPRSLEKDGRKGGRKEGEEKPPHPNPLPHKAGGEGTGEAQHLHAQPSIIDHQPRRSPIDAYIVARLEAEQMQPAPSADRATLIKRLSFDLLGLPPTYEEVEDFIRDPAPDAYERLVDRLLSSPHFGERAGRHWLDLVRYADTCGYERDQELPQAWKYRDWVVRAINEDKPFNEFILEQLAGDELPDRSESSVIATGFLRLGTWNDEPNDPDEYKYERLEDMVHVTSTAFLGLTVKCARCHDHKFDPIPQTDYYRMAAAFWPGAVEPRGRELLGGPSKEELGFDVLGWTDIRQPPPLHLLRKGEPKQPLGVVEPGHLSLIPAMDRPLEPAPLGAKTTHRRRQLAEWIASPDNPLTPRVLANRLWMTHFGAGLVRSADNFGFTGDKPSHPELLEWLSDECRVSSARGNNDPPEVSGARHLALGTQPSLKRLHRLLVTSATYRQSSLHPRQDEYAARDAGNHLWWHAERRRLDAEPLRDRLLFVGNDLDTRMTGPGFKPTIQAEALEGLSRKEGAWKPSPLPEQRRRAVYMFSQRSLLPPLMTTFDFVDTTLPCVQRPVSTVAPQALALLNNAFAHERSQALATVVLSLRRQDVPSAERRDYGSDIDPQIRLAWRLALARDPSSAELLAAREHIRNQQQRWPSAPSRPLASLCHVLLNTNEFAYID